MEFIPNIPSLRNSKVRKIVTAGGLTLGSTLLGASSIHSLSKKEDTPLINNLSNQIKEEKREHIRTQFGYNELAGIVETQNKLLADLCEKYDWSGEAVNMRCEYEDELE